MPSSYYDLANYDDEDERANGSLPPIINLCAAASYIGHLLTSHGLQYAVQGGFAMVCRGSPRTTVDVDIATNASMKQLWQIMEPRKGHVLPRLVIPNSRLLDKVLKIFVKTGPSHGDAFCTEDKEVEVDLNIFGIRSGDSGLRNHVEEIKIEFEGHVLHVNILDVFFMLRTKLRTLVSRAAARDYDDIDFLLKSYGQQIKNIADQVDLQDRAFFIDTDMVQCRGPSMVRQYRSLLQLEA